MAKYRIAWLPGDGIGNEVMEAAKIVLDAISLDAEYIHGDIGWEFWCKEGDAFPARTIELLKNVDAAMFGAITSKPVKAAEKELVPELKGKGLIYRSPIVRMRQLFDLYICLRPCKAYPGNPLNFKEGIDLVVFRENTEDLYCRRRVQPGAPGAGRHAAEALEAVRRLQGRAARPVRDLHQDQHPQGLRADHPRGLRVRREVRPQEGHLRPQGQRGAGHRRAVPGDFQGGRQGVTRDPTDDANIDAMCMWLLKNPFNYDVLVAPNLYGDIISDLCAQMVGGLGFGCSGNIGEKLAVFEPTHGSAPKYAGHVQVQSHRHDPGGQDDAGLAGREGEGRRAGGRPSRPSSPRAQSAPTTWAALRPSTWPRRSRRNCDQLRIADCGLRIAD